jgi:antitoxin (DNA-binding transcriptional repressor) of toxin-antitoxin stability system
MAGKVALQDAAVRHWQWLSARNAGFVSSSRVESSRSIMKVIPLSKAKAKLSYYSRLCQREPVIVTVKGTPVFQMVPLNEEDDLINQLLENNPDFRQILKKCLDGPSVSAKEALNRLK